MIATEREGEVAVVTLDRPERRNALTREGLGELADAVAAADAPALYLHGAGLAFCAGADLDEVAGLDGREDAREFAAAGQAVARALATYDGAVVAGIDGAARGGGVELALACDVRACTPEATLGETGVALGLFGAWGGTARLPRVVGPGVAADLALSGRVLDAQAALAVGLVSRVTGRPRAVAEAIAAHDADAVRAIARLVRGGGDRGRGAATPDPGDDPLSAAEEREREAFADLVAGGAPREADRREPPDRSGDERGDQ